MPWSPPQSNDPLAFPPDSVLRNSRRHYPTPRGGLRTVSPLPPENQPQMQASMQSKASTGVGLRIQGGLDPFVGQLDATRARHLLRRTGFGASPTEVSALIGSEASDAVDVIVDAAINNPHPATPAWASTLPPGPTATDEEWIAYNEWTLSRLDEFRIDWLKLMTTNGLREKLTLFWHDHFATTEDKYYHAQIAQRHVALLRYHSIGNFKQFVHDVGLDPAMLIFLDGVLNRNDAPNENYARELCELFTMGIVDRNGQPNYSQADITEIARGLTGRVILGDLSVNFYPLLFDEGEKSVFGQVGTWGYDEIINIVFSERGQETAWYICKKLYQEFVYEEVDEAIVEQLADLFVASDYEIAPVLRTLLKSNHFFDSQVIGARISSPTEMMIRFLKELGGYNDVHFTIAFWASWGLRQVLTLVPSVNGWPRHRDWISTTSVPERWAVCGWMVWDKEISGGLDLTPTLSSLVDFQDPYLAFRIGPALVEHLFAVPVDQLDIETVSAPFAGDLTTHPIPQDVLDAPAYVRDLTKLFLNGVPWYEWSPYNTEMDWVIRLFLSQLAQIPEFQLT